MQGRLKNKLSRDVQNIIKTLVEPARVFGMNIYFVGGILRDLLLDIAVKDIDIVVEGDAIAFCRLLEVQGLLKIKSVHSDFGTAKTIIKDEEVDFASTRQEDYPRSGCLPVVKNIGCPLQEDVSRRDFTINAIALDLTSFELIDYTGGIKDLENKILKITYDKSFIDDPTRMLRALDFRLRFGFKIDEHTKEMQERYLKKPDRECLSISRVDLTLKKLFKNNDPKTVYEYILKEKLYRIFTDKEPKLTAVNLEKARELCKGSADVYIKSLKNDLPSKSLELEERSPLEIYNFFKQFSSDDLTLYLAKSNDMRVLEFKSKYENVKINTTGNDLIKMGYKEGVQIGTILQELLAKNLKEPMSAAQEKQWVLSNYKF